MNLTVLIYLGKLHASLPLALFTPPPLTLVVIIFVYPFHLFCYTLHSFKRDKTLLFSVFHLSAKRAARTK